VFFLSLLYVALLWVGRGLLLYTTNSSFDDSHIGRDPLIGVVNPLEAGFNLDSSDVHDQNHDHNNLWHNSTTIPKWMKQYFHWHRYQRLTNVNPQNWRKLDYLVLRCMKMDIKCGDVSVRLKPLPSLLLVAFLSKRLLMIVWDKPAPLEEFLLPPVGGLDWRAPSWLIPHIAYTMYPRANLNTVLHIFNSNITSTPLKVLNVKYQQEETAGM
jgi:hypothetical protein